MSAMISTANSAISAIQFVGMALYGVEAWCARGEAFGVYFGLFARMSPWARIDGTLGLLLADKVVQLAAVGGRREASKANAAAGQEIEHHVEMLELFIDDRGHLPAQVDVFDVRKDKI